MKRGVLRIRCFAKINLGLKVLARRSDGYHEIRTILQTIDLHDDLRIEPASSFSLKIRIEGAGARGHAVPIDQTNLVLMASKLLAKRLGGRCAAFTLTKRIPAGAGMGGASSDGAAALIALDRLFGLGLSASEMHVAAGSLGSDVPFFLYGGACLAIGLGEEVFPLPDGPRLNLARGVPEVGLGTPEVYKAWDDLLTSPGKISRVNDFAPWCLVLHGESPTVANDLEEAAVGLCSDLRALRSALETAGSSAVAMTGSGSAFFGIFTAEAGARKAAAALERTGFAAFTAKSLSRAERDAELWVEDPPRRSDGEG